MDENTPWTSIDFYYKGFHVKKSTPNTLKPEEIVAIVDDYISKGFEPSWNNETNYQQLDPTAKFKPTPKTCPECGVGDVVEKTSKDGRAYYACSEGKWDKVHKKATGCRYFMWRDEK